METTANPVGIGSSYIRVSRRAQVTERQRASITEWARRRGVAITHVFEDQGSRDKSEERADLQKLLRHIEQGHIQWVLVEDLDRFGVKDAYELSSFIYKLRQHGCQLWSVADDKCISGGNDETVLTNVIRGLTSEKEQYVKGNRALSSKLDQARKGEWVGGYVPYGCDVVCKREGQIVWRMVVEGKDRRITIEDHKVVRYDGPNVVPPHNKVTDKLFLVPSVRAERIKTVNDIFRWFAEEAISTGKIANRLNARGEMPVYAQAWYPMLVDGMLRNPVYLGLPTYNKKAHGRFFQYQGGKISKAPRRNNYYSVTGRKRDASDQITPEGPIFDPIVPPELFQKVQRKLEARSARVGKRPPRAPKDDRLWLAGLVFCGKCGQKMNGSMYAKEKGDQRSFLCSTAAKFGRDNNPTGCRSHRVRHAVLEQYVTRFLDEAGLQFEAWDAENLGNLDKLATVWQGLIKRGLSLQAQALQFIHGCVDAEGEAGKIAKQGIENLSRMSASMRFEADSGKDQPVSIEHAKFYFGYTLQVYREVFAARQHGLEAELAEKRAQLERMVESYQDLEVPSAKKIANAKMASVEEAILALESRLRPLEESRRELVAELSSMKGKFAEAMRASEGQDNRRKAEAIRQVIGRIVCHFEYRQHGQQTRSVISGVDIEPVLPGDGSFSNETSPAPG